VKKFEIGQLLRFKPDDGKGLISYGLPCRLTDGKWKLTGERHVQVSEDDAVLVIACTTIQIEWFIGLANDRFAFLPKRGFVRL